MTGGAAHAPRWIGRWLMAVGAWHTLFGLWWFAAPLGRVVRAGVWNSVGWSDPGRAAAFWFLATGAFALLAGSLVDDAEARSARLPVRFGWGLTAVALIGGVLLPVSGFWLLLVPGIGALRARRRAAGMSLPSSLETVR